MTALGIMGLTPRSAVTSGEIILDGENLISLDEKAMCAIRGRKVAMIFQEPMTALNPLQPIGVQVAETFLTHSDISRADAIKKASETLTRVGMPPDEISPKRRPHELSGGQRQRVVIAIAIAMTPQILIADEPTTALDVTTQAEILDLLKTLATEDNIALLLITHDLAVVSSIADRVAVIKDGSIVANSPVEHFYKRDANEVAGEFLPARVKRHTSLRADKEIVLKVENIVCEYRQNHTLFAGSSSFTAVDNISFKIAKGENLGLVGESGCGKSTLAKAMLALHPLAKGQVTIDGKVFPAVSKKDMRRMRQKIQIVFQDPYSSFNPRQRIIDIVTEPLHLLDQPFSASEKLERAIALLNSVGLDDAAAAKHPHEFSGGQRQRIAIARALATEPSIIVLDEATSALDIAARNKVLDLLQSLSHERGVSFLFITHDLSVIRDITDRVMVMRNGKIVESGPTEDVFLNPAEPYTRTLIDAAPVIEWR
jgi:peptide/nickel transport system ATP-binding protein